MQTFLPYASFIQSAQCLDNRRLNKQIIEVGQILNAIDDPTYGWQNHPAVNMWRKHTAHLAEYGWCCCVESRDRQQKVDSDLMAEWLLRTAGKVWESYPPFLDNEPFHTSHQCNLLRKAPIYYSQHFKHPLYALVPYIWWSPIKRFYTIKK